MSLSRAELYEYWESRPEYDNVFSADCDAVEYVLDNCEITVLKENKFSVSVNCDCIGLQIIRDRAVPFDEISEKLHGAAKKSKAYDGKYDFNHSTPDWESLFTLGFSGLRSRIKEYSNKNSENSSFYCGLIKVYDAAIRFISRAASVARINGNDNMANGFENLTQNPPQNLYEAIQLLFISYTLLRSVEGTGANIDSLGRADQLLQPFICSVSEKEADALLDDMMLELDSQEYGGNIPFAICGTDENGNDATNEASYKLLDAYRRNRVIYVKLHFLCSEKTPDDIIIRAFDSIRNGSNGIVFISDETVKRALIKQGASKKDADSYHVVGCYECGAYSETTCSCNGEFSIPKAVEYALFSGKDAVTGEMVGLENGGVFSTFDDLFEEFKRQLSQIITKNIALIDLYENNHKHLHAAPLLSGTYVSSLESGKDIYAENGARYCNSSLNAIGLATATDALFAIKKLVYEDKTVTLDELREILANNWQGNEQLRMTVKNKFPKFGMNNPEVDGIARLIMDAIYPEVCGKPNKKGGTYRLGTFSIDWRWEFGKMTGASADGRYAGEPLSQNASASFGSDREGVTAHLLSVAGAIDSEFTPNGTIVDIDLHESAVKGDMGLNAMLGTLRAYFKQGGFAVHYNVLNTKTLEKARVNPKDYPTLQVRVCGWNSKFVSLSEESQCEFIERSKK